jgi:hypothetical protein
MKITYNQTYQAPLTDIGAELVRMIKDRDYNLIAERFAYALAYDRPIAEAIASDIDFCLGGEGRSSVIGLAHEPRIQVSYFGQPNGSGLFGLVECFLQLDNDTGELLATLIITNEDQAYFACLEDLAYVA